MSEYVLGFAFRHDNSGTLVLIRKSHPEAQANLLNGVGGKVEADETPHQAMAREFVEETGAWIEKNRWVHFATLNTTNGMIHLFACNEWDTDYARTMDGEEIVFAHKDHLPSDIVPDLRWMVPMAYNSLHTEFRYINMVTVG